jgi:hypothetical protein
MPNPPNVYYDIWGGEYVYRFTSPNVPCTHGPFCHNLALYGDDTIMSYYCRASPDEKTMSIISDDKIFGGQFDDLTTVYGWERKFIKIK